MGEPKAFASLSSGLLARKGAARPAMRPQGFGQVGAGLEDLGWNDMGFEAPKPALTPVRDDHHDAFGEELAEPALRHPLAALTPITSPVHDQHAEIADRFADYTEESGDDEYVDETAELYDPEAEATAIAEGEDEEGGDEAEIVLDAPLLSTKPNRTVVAPVTFAPAPVVAPLVVPAAIGPAVAPVAPAAAPVARAQPAPARTPRPRAASGSKAKAAFTLRLDGDRHLRLRLACAVTGRSAQQLVTEALDQLLGAMPEVESMADRAPSKRANR
jgi:hypothetical protein